MYTDFKLAHTLIITGLINFTGLYAGAIFIAVVAALVRIFYMDERPIDGKNYFFTLTRYFFMSLGITLLMVHVGLAQGWSPDQTIIISGASAFLSYEIITVVIEIFPRLLKRWLTDKIIK